MKIKALTSAALMLGIVPARAQGGGRRSVRIPHHWHRLARSPNALPKWLARTHALEDQQKDWSLGWVYLFPTDVQAARNTNPFLGVA